MPHIDISFRVQGETIPVDHGYVLFSAISKTIPRTHGEANLAILPINGRLAGNRKLEITAKSRLVLRVNDENVNDYLALSGNALRVGESELKIGVPESKVLIPKSRLYSRLVVIKGFTEPDSFVEAADRQLDQYGIQSRASLIYQGDISDENSGKNTGTHSKYLRRTINIHGREIVGFAVMVEGLTAEESIILQENGLGGRRRFGCGVFIPMN